MATNPTSIGENLSRIETEIAAACARAGRVRSEVALVAVTKTHPASAIVEAAALGITLFGENRVQEFQQKRGDLSRLGYLFDGEAEAAQPNQAGSHLNAEFHLIGHLQSNKAARAVELFSSIDSVDSLRLAERLNDAAAPRKRRLPVLLEIKLSAEEAKSGFHPDSTELSDLLDRLPEMAALEPRGLMTVPPFLEDAEAARPYFIRLRALRDGFARTHPHLGLIHLSMGMSHDFSVAIEEGATQIRIGTALFGARPPGQSA